MKSTGLGDDIEKFAKATSHLHEKIEAIIHTDEAGKAGIRYLQDKDRSAPQLMETYVKLRVQTV